MKTFREVITESAKIKSVMDGALTDNFTDMSGKVVKGATWDQVRDAMKASGIRLPSTPVQAMAALRQSTGLDIISVDGKRNGKGRQIKFWTVSQVNKADAAKLASGKAAASELESNLKKDKIAFTKLDVSGDEVTAFLKINNERHYIYHDAVKKNEFELLDSDEELVLKGTYAAIAKHIKGL